jgi:predicted  nucleic acid-binding Zn-ribbon protein
VFDSLIRLQNIDLDIEAHLNREKEIPKQKEKFEIHRTRLAKELEESEKKCTSLILEQRDCEGEIEQKQADIHKKDTQLLAVKKNEEYQALLHEMELLKKQISVKEERIITIMLESDEAKEHFEEDKKRIALEQQEIESQCNTIDEELSAAVLHRKKLQSEREPLAKEIDPLLLLRYLRVRKAKKIGAALVPLTGESCSGCHMMVTAQVVNEILAGDRAHACSHCGRLLYNADSVQAVINED